jgi:hypothetical protein
LTSPLPADGGVVTYAIESVLDCNIPFILTSILSFCIAVSNELAEDI